TPATSMNSQPDGSFSQFSTGVKSSMPLPTTVAIVGLLLSEKSGAVPNDDCIIAQKRSNCLGCQGCLVYFLVLNLLGLPGRPMLQHGIKNRQQLMHTRRQRDFFEFPRSEQPLIKGFDRRIKPCRHERA